MTARPTTRDLDTLLIAQLAVAWAGEGGEEPRLGWWRSDLVSEFGGHDLFQRLLPHTWEWAALQGAREAAPYDPSGLSASPTHDPGDKAHRAAYLRDHPEEALAAVEIEALRRLRARKKSDELPDTGVELTLLEPGLWSALPERCWDLELRLIAKPQSDFHLRAPDEPEARAAFEAANPKRVADREEHLRGQSPQPSLLEV